MGDAAVVGGEGYNFVARDGGMFCFGSAAFLGSMSGTTQVSATMVGMTSM